MTSIELIGLSNANGRRLRGVVTGQGMFGTRHSEPRLAKAAETHSPRGEEQTMAAFAISTLLSGALVAAKQLEL